MFCRCVRWLRLGWSARGPWAWVRESLLVNGRTVRRRSETRSAGDGGRWTVVIRPTTTDAHQLHDVADAAAGTSLLQRTLSGRRRPRIACRATAAVRSTYTGIEPFHRREFFAQTFIKISRHSSYVAIYNRDMDYGVLIGGVWESAIAHFKQ